MAENDLTLKEWHGERPPNCVCPMIFAFTDPSDTIFHLAYKIPPVDWEQKINCLKFGQVLVIKTPVEGNSWNWNKALQFLKDNDVETVIDMTQGGYFDKTQLFKNGFKNLVFLSPISTEFSMEEAVEQFKKVDIIADAMVKEMRPICLISVVYEQWTLVAAAQIAKMCPHRFQQAYDKQAIDQKAITSPILMHLFYKN